MVKVKLFGTLRGYVAGYDHTRGVDVAVGAGGTIGDALDILGIPRGAAGLFVVDGVARTITHGLNDSEEVSIFLPMAGG